ncbi:MAG: T9SS type A sorting domain-containing protein, partial [Chitinophagaceae bacterium]|nr:T9SS type A sorting domain-containing protein [Chitinophagaceae bacterium]
YELINLPPGVTIVWEIQNGRIRIDNGQGTNKINVTKLATGSEIVKATITNICGASLSITKNIQTGGYGSGDYPITGPSTVSCNQYVTYSTNSLLGATNYQWTWPSSWTYTSGQGTRSITFYIGSGSTSGSVTVRVANACDLGGSPAVKNVSVSGCGFYVLAPNPATSEVTVTSTETTTMNSSTDGSITEINIYDQQGNLKKQKKYDKVKKAVVDLSGLSTGIYIIEIVNESYKEQQQLTVLK